MKQGILITFEGSEGCGKSTQIRLLAATLKRKGYRVLLTREPGGTAVGERIRHLLKFSKSNTRMVPECELLLFSASRAQLVEETIQPALQKGWIVLCDRFADSTTVYQGVARKLDRQFIATLQKFVLKTCRPQITFVLDHHVGIGLSRARKKTRLTDRMEAQKKSFYESVRRGFRQLAKQEPRRVKLINASKSIPEVRQQIEDHLWKILPK